MSKQLILTEEQISYFVELATDEHRSWLVMNVAARSLMEKRAKMIVFTEDLLVLLTGALENKQEEVGNNSYPSYILWGSDDDDWRKLEEVDSLDKINQLLLEEPPYSYIKVTGGTILSKNTRGQEP